MTAVNIAPPYGPHITTDLVLQQEHIQVYENTYKERILDIGFGQGLLNPAKTQGKDGDVKVNTAAKTYSLQKQQEPIPTDDSSCEYTKR